ncbi:protein grpE [Nitritalea halalkaliphila LW7]|uniref:Protein GrpE n=1 Tax=Nitritalea halalkaliphila LW7 TaxID=1189621 RepID=I5CAG2_9BACT|nr:nucleotide exchange factor GrpE [Nitritalea halalkaliphila]EIM78814.1 protein grpE [Nitritalea halalkaliphila LW7]
MAEKEHDKSTLQEEELEQQIADEQQAADEAAATESTTSAAPETDTPVSEEAQVYKDKYLRLYSEFDNYRRRTAKERLDLIKTASEEVLKAVIPVLDDFERAAKAHAAETDAEKVRDGNQIVVQKLMKTLEQKGLKPMEDAVGKPFDADFQEAITQIPAPSEELKGKVVDVVEKGYMLGDRVVRYAKVVIGA